MRAIRRLMAKGNKTTVATTAIAREIAAFLSRRRPQRQPRPEKGRGRFAAGYVADIANHVEPVPVPSPT